MPDEATTRASLLARARNTEDVAAWKDFDHAYRPLVLKVARSRGLSAEDAQDVAQATMISVAAALPGFEYDPRRCHFRSWLGTLVRRRIADHYRHHRPSVRPLLDPSGTAAEAAELAVHGDASPLEALWNTEWERSILDAAWERLKSAVRPLHFQVLHLRLREDRAFSEISEILGMSLNAVYLAHLRTGRRFRRLVREARREADLRDERVIRSATVPHPSP